MSEPDGWVDIDTKSSYGFMPGKTTEDWHDVILYEKDFNHGGWRAILYGDTHVQLNPYPHASP